MCHYCNGSVAVASVGREFRGHIEGEEFVADVIFPPREGQSKFDFTDRKPDIRYKIKYCPYCGMLLKTTKKWTWDDGMLDHTLDLEEV